MSRMSYTFTDKHLDYCSNSYQKSIIESLIDTGGYKKTGKELGLEVNQVKGVARRVYTKASLQGYAPEHDMQHTVPETHYVKAVSTCYDNEGNIKQQWVKSDSRKENLGMVAEKMVEALLQSNPLPKVKTPKLKSDKVNTDTLTVYPMGDPHLGMYSWVEETGENFDLDIAERDLKTAIDKLVSIAPNSEQALICNLGDFFHSDDSTNMTRRSGNVLDVDGRWAKVLRVGVRAMTYVIEKALEKHKKVNVINEIGNHDDSTSYVLSLILDAYFRDCDRVNINLSPATFHYFEFGKNLIGVTHGHNTKYGDLGPIMATDKPQEWGRTTNRYWYVGHVHHHQSKEYHGCTVESFRTLAGKDAWHSSKGYRSQRDMKCIVLHKEFGEINRHTIGIDFVHYLQDTQ